MSRQRSVLWLGSALACGLASAAMADETAPTPQEMAQQIQELRAEVAQFKATQGDNWLNERRAQEIKGLVKEVLADADTRAAMTKDMMTGGWDGKNFFLANGDKTFLMQIGTRVQIRYIANFRQDAPSSSVTANSGGSATSPPTGGSGGTAADDMETGFTLRRIEPYIKGYVGSPKITYKVVFAADRNTSNFFLEELSLGYQILDNLQVLGGRFKAPFLREEINSAGKQLAVERSDVNSLFTMGYTDGIELVYDVVPMVRLSGMFSDGQGSGEYSQGTSSTGGQDFDRDNADYALTGRVDWKVVGDWKQIDDFNSWSGESLGIFLGTAVHWEQAETTNNGLSSNGGTGNTGTNLLAPVYGKFLAVTADGSIEYAGFGFYGAWVMKKVYGDGAGSTGDFDEYGAIAQASYMVIPDKLEPFVRYEWFDGGGRIPSTGATTSSVPTGRPDNAQLVTMGVNYYLKKHAAKFTLDVVYVLDPLNKAQSGAGLEQDSAAGDKQVAVRGQFQLDF